MKRKLLDFFRLVWKIRLLEKILVRFTLDKTFGSLVTKFPPNHYQYPPNTFRSAQRHGINYTLDISDIVDWYIYYGFKETSRYALYELLNEGDHVLDIGANVGDVTLHFAKIVGKGGFVHSFEPDTVNFHRLKTNVHQNSFSNISIHKFGLGDMEGTFQLANIEVKNRGMNKIIPTGTNESFDEIQVKTLDSFRTKNKLQRVDIIKIDVEGFELNVLKGAADTLNTHRPTLFVELDDNNLREQGASASELIQFLEKKEYLCLHSETSDEIASGSDFKNCHFDVIAKPI